MEAKEATLAFAALSQETRLALLRLLMAQGPSGLPAGEIATRLNVPASTLSFHLAALERAGLTQATRQGRLIVHAARIAGVRQLLSFLTETCCGGRPELCGDIARLLPAYPTEDKGMTPAFNVLFLCTHNSARSIMAEALLQTIGAGRFRAYSAGSEPIAAPLPEVVEKLRAFGHDVSGLRSKSWDEFLGASAPRMDFVITLCDTPEGQICPDFGDACGHRRMASARPGQVHRQRGRTFLDAERTLCQPAPPDGDLHLPAVRLARPHGDEGAARRNRRRCPAARGSALTMRIGINGMGRIGRLTLRAAMGGIVSPGRRPARW